MVIVKKSKKKVVNKEAVVLRSGSYLIAKKTMLLVVTFVTNLGKTVSTSVIKSEWKITLIVITRGGEKPAQSMTVS